MKAWEFFPYNREWSTLVHAETRGQAIAKCQNMYEPLDFVDCRARRVPGLDDKPITFQNAKLAGFEYLDDWDGDSISPEQFVNDCQCEICSSKAETEG